MAISERFRSAARRLSSVFAGSAPSQVLHLSDVVSHERAALTERRRHAERLRGETRAGEDPQTAAGLAFSGGGIRSATFCLGFLQALSHANLLTRFDYLSTVSGGGFTGGWWIAWLSRHLRRAGPGQQPPVSLFPGAEAVWLDGTDAQKTTVLAGRDPVRFLRLFSNYLTPRRSTFSQDTWRAVAVITRNLTLTWLSLLPLLFAAVCFMQAWLALEPGFAAQCTTNGVVACWSTRWALLGPIFGWLGGIAGLVLAAETLAWLVVGAKFGHRPHDASSVNEEQVTASDARLGRILATSVIQGLFIGLLVFQPRIGNLIGWPFALGGSIDSSMLYSWGAASLVLFALYWPLAALKPLHERRDLLRTWIVRLHATTLVASVVVAAVLVFAAFGDLAWTSTVAAGQWGIAKAGGIAGLALTVAGALYSALKAAPAGGGEGSHRHEHPRSRALWACLTAVPWVVLAVLGCFAAWFARAAFHLVHAEVVAFLDPRLIAIRTRLAAPATPPLIHTWLVIGALAATALVLVLAFAELGSKRGLMPLAVGLLLVWIARLQIQVVPPWILKTAITAVVALLWFGALYDNTTLRRAKHVGRVVAVSYIASLAIVITWWAMPSSAPVPDLHGDHVRDAATLLVFAAVVAARFVIARRMPLLVIVLLGSATALGGAIAAASLHPAIDLEWWDFSTLIGLGGTALASALALGWMIDPNLVSLHGFYRDRLVRAYLGASNERRAASDAQVTDAVAGDDLPLAEARSDLLGGPLPLINTTLNLLAAHDLGIVQRRSANFTLSPLHCGCTRTGFRPTAEYMSGALTLGGAVAVSGAAASPAMGTLQISSAQTMLMTLLNIRLGFWAPNPAEPSWRLPQARLWTLASIRELLSQTDETSSYCYLTDGGHFDNTGLYPLVQRACRTIVVVDCGRDTHPPQLADLAQAIRLCRIDFGTEITLPVGELAEEELTPFVVGQIRYSHDHLSLLGLPDECADGVIVCVKPGVWLEGCLAADVLQYRRAHSEFPQQSTGDQWFDEAQFESYRKLGESIGKAAVKTIAERFDNRDPRSEEPLFPARAN